MAIQQKGTIVESLVDEASNHDVPEENICGIGRREEGIGVRDEAHRGVVGNEIGGEEEIEVKVGSVHGGLDRF